MKLKKKKNQHPDLNLRGPVPDIIKKFKIMKNIPLPTNRWNGGKWDHLIVKLEEGDCVDFGKNEAISFGNRARNLNYVIVMRKMSEDMTRVWFEGLDPRKPKKKK